MMIEVGDFYCCRKTATAEQVQRIAEVSGDVNPVHLDEKYAETTIFGRKIAHGLFCVNLISEILGNHLPGPGTILLSQQFKYCKPVYLGDEITAVATVEGKNSEKNLYTIHICCQNQEQKTVMDSVNTVKWMPHMYKLSDMISHIDGKLVRDGMFSTLEYCTSVCEDAFLSFLENPKFVQKVNPNASCLLVTQEIADIISEYHGGLVITENPKKEFVKLHNALANDPNYGRRRFKTVIGQNCKISPLAKIAEENVVIEDDVQIGDFSVIKENVTIRNGTIIHENCVIGGKSFNFAKAEDGSMLGMQDLGQVVLGKNVEICPLCHVAGAPLPTDCTELGDYVKLDALVHIGHGTKVGAGTELPAGAMVAGNCVVGKNAWIGVNSTVSNRIKIGDGGRVSLGAVVTKDVEKGQTVTGNFAVDHKRFIAELREKNQATEY